MDRLSLIKPLKTVLNHLFVPRCLLCQQHSHSQYPLCEYCINDIEVFDYSDMDNLMLRPDIRRGLPKPQFRYLAKPRPVRLAFQPMDSQPQVQSPLRHRRFYGKVVCQSTAKPAVT